MAWLGATALVFGSVTRQPRPLTKAEALKAELWFRKHGLVSMMRGTGYAAGAARLAAPVLVAEFLLVMVLNAISSPGLSLLGGLAITVVTVVVTWVAANLARRRPPFASVKKIGWIEGLAFVLVPAVVAAFTPQEELELDPTTTFAGAEAQAATAIVIALLQLVVLLGVWVFILSGVGSLARLLSRQLGKALSATTTVLAAVIPVMLGFVFFFFLNPGVWLVVANMDLISLAGLVGFLVLLSGLFLGSRAQFALEPLTEFETADDLRDALATTPLADDHDTILVPASVTLDLRQEGNLRLVAVVSRLVTAGVLAGVVFAIFLVLGFIALGPAPIEAWTKLPPSPIFSVTIGGHVHLIAWQHLRVALFLAAFSGFNYALISATDPRLRQNATDAATVIARQACALRVVVLARARAAAEQGATPGRLD